MAKRAPRLAHCARTNPYTLTTFKNHTSTTTSFPERYLPVSKPNLPHLHPYRAGTAHPRYSPHHFQQLFTHTYNFRGVLLKSTLISHSRHSPSVSATMPQHEHSKTVTKGTITRSNLTPHFTTQSYNRVSSTTLVPSIRKATFLPPRPFDSSLGLTFRLDDLSDPGSAIGK